MHLISYKPLLLYTSRISGRKIISTSVNLHGCDEYMVNKLGFFVLFSILLLISLSGSHPVNSSGNVYHVSLNGNDANPGTESQPWRTPSYAVSKLNPGDTLIIHGGVYSDVVEIQVSGTADAPITIKGAEGEEVIFDFNGIHSNCFIFRQGVSYLNVRNLKLRNCGIWVVSFDGENRHITLSKLEIERGESGIHMTTGHSGEEPMQGPVEYITINDSKIHDITYSAIDCTPGPCNYLVFSNLEIYRNGIEAGFGADGLAIETGNHIVIENVYSHDNGGDGIDVGSRNPLIFEEASDVRVSRCRVERNKMNGIKLWTGGVIENTVMYDNCLSPLVFVYNGEYLLVNSIIAGNSRSPECRDYSAIIGYPEPEALGRQDDLKVGIYNTIFAFNGPLGAATGIYVGRGASLTSDYNIWYSRQDSEIYIDSTQQDYGWEEISGGRWTADTGNGEHSIVADPMFINLEAGDLHPGEGSPAIDAGAMEYCPNVDLDGGERPVGAGCDIGAYEYGATPTTVTATTSWPTLTTTPPPATATTPITTPTTVQPTTTPLLTPKTLTVTKTVTQTITERTITQPLRTETITQTVTSTAPQPKPEETQPLIWLIGGLAVGALMVAVASLILKRRR